MKLQRPANHAPRNNQNEVILFHYSYYITIRFSLSDRETSSTLQLNDDDYELHVICIYRVKVNVIGRNLSRYCVSVHIHV